MKNKTIGCIGTGVMGSAIIKVLAKTIDSKNIIVSDIDYKKVNELCEKIHCTQGTSNTDVTKNSDYLFLAIKPQYVTSVLSEIAPVLKQKTIVISMVAGVAIKTISEQLAGHQYIIRIMPNTPIQTGAGLIALAFSDWIDKNIIQNVQNLLAQAGLVEIVNETLMDAVTAVSGSGPAYGYVFIDALADAAVAMGMSREQAITYAAQTLKGASEMVLFTGKGPSVLKDEVCSPGGTTIAGITALEEHGFRNAIIKATFAAWERSKKISL